MNYTPFQCPSCQTWFHTNEFLSSEIRARCPNCYDLIPQPLVEYAQEYLKALDRYLNDEPQQITYEPQTKAQEESRVLFPEIDRRVSGVCVKQDKDIWLCSRGSFTIFRGRIKRDIAFSFFDKWLIEVEDDKQQATVVPIAALSSPDLPNQLANFVVGVNELKEKCKSDQINIEEVLSQEVWNDGDEYEGRITSIVEGGQINYEYLHGPICNELKRYLSNTLSGDNNFKVRRNRNIDVAIVKNDKAVGIFEVKTSASLAEQVLKGIGQLFYYKFRYGNEASRLFLVLPGKDNVEFRYISQLMEELHIHLIIYDSGNFSLAGGGSIEQLF